MLENLENIGREEIGLVTPTPVFLQYSGLYSKEAFWYQHHICRLKGVIVIHKKELQFSAPSQHWETLENANIFLSYLRKIQDGRG